jgi:AcrR family transcriptional regulator
MTRRTINDTSAVQLRPGRGRRVAADVRAATLAAAAELLFEHGVSGVTFDKVAARAGVSKMTLYKWWPSPGALAFEAYFSAVEPELRFGQDNDVATDLKAQLHAFIRLIVDQRRGRVLRELIGAAQSDPALAVEFTQAYTRPRRRLAVERLRLAQAAGEIRDDVDLEVLVDQLWGAAYHRLLLPAEPLSEEFADTLVDNLLRGIGATSARRGRTGRAYR